MNKKNIYLYLNDNLLSLYELCKKFKDKLKLNIKIMIENIKDLKIIFITE